jgi:hypothetical protein
MGSRGKGTWFSLLALRARIPGITKDFQLFRGIRSRILQTFVALGTIVVFIRLALREHDPATIFGSFLSYYIMLGLFSVYFAFVYFNFFEIDLARETEKAREAARLEAGRSGRHNEFIKTVLKSSSGTLVSSAGSMMQGLDSFALNTQNQAASTEEVSASIEEVTAGADSVARSAEEQHLRLGSLLGAIAELTRIIRVLGEEPEAGRLARAIAVERVKAPFASTGQLSSLIERVKPRRGARLQSAPNSKGHQAGRGARRPPRGAERRASWPRSRHAGARAARPGRRNSCGGWTTCWRSTGTSRGR